MPLSRRSAPRVPLLSPVAPPPRSPAHHAIDVATGLGLWVASLTALCRTHGMSWAICSRSTGTQRSRRSVAWQVKVLTTHTQLFCSHMAEPDGLAGIAALRSALLSAQSSNDSASTVAASAATQPKATGGAGAGAGAGGDTTADGADSAGSKAGNGGRDAHASEAVGYEAALALREQLIDHEQNANWNEAMMCYEQALHNLGTERTWFNAVQTLGGSVVAEERCVYVCGVCVCSCFVQGLRCVLLHCHDGCGSTGHCMGACCGVC